MRNVHCPSGTAKKFSIHGGLKFEHEFILPLSWYFLARSWLACLSSIMKFNPASVEDTLHLSIHSHQVELSMYRQWFPTPGSTSIIPPRIHPSLSWHSRTWYPGHWTNTQVYGTCKSQTQSNRKQLYALYSVSRQLFDSAPLPPDLHRQNAGIGTRNPEICNGGYAASADALAIRCRP